MSKHCGELLLIIVIYPYEIMSQLGGPVDWVIMLSASGNKVIRRKRLGNLLFFWWQVWKEKPENL
jgi:hypothetical protein